MTPTTNRFFRLFFSLVNVALTGVSIIFLYEAVGDGPVRYSTENVILLVMVILTPTSGLLTLLLNVRQMGAMRRTPVFALTSRFLIFPYCFTALVAALWGITRTVSRIKDINFVMKEGILKDPVVKQHLIIDSAFYFLWSAILIVYASWVIWDVGNNRRSWIRE